MKETLAIVVLCGWLDYHVPARRWGTGITPCRRCRTALYRDLMSARWKRVES